jgi:hypothetical protein
MQLKESFEQFKKKQIKKEKKSFLKLLCKKKKPLNKLKRLKN